MKHATLVKGNSCNNITNHFKGSNTASIIFIDFKSPIHIYNEVKNGNISIEQLEEDKAQFKLKINEITTGNRKHKSKDQLDTIKNIKNLYNSIDKVIKLFNYYAKIISETMNKTKQRAWLKILFPKQILQRLPKALAQVKASNDSEDLLNKIRQIVYSLYQTKNITKNVCNNIIKSRKL